MTNEELPDEAAGLRIFFNPHPALERPRPSACPLTLPLVKDSPPAVQAATVEPVEPQFQKTIEPRPLHWPSNGKFPMPVIGESFCKENIKSIAHNQNGAGALVYCTASMQPEPENEHDANAVAVMIEGKKVGFLPRDFAPQYIQTLAGLELSGTVTCDAVIHGGGTFDGVAYDYCVELDFSLESKPDDGTPTYPTLHFACPDPVVFNQNADEYFLRVPFVDDYSLELSGIGEEVGVWEPPDASLKVLYAPGSSGGAGRIALFRKSLNPQMFELLDNTAHLSVYKIEGRDLVLRGGAPPEPEPKYAYRGSGRVSILLLNIDPAQLPPKQVVVKTFLIDSLSANGKLAKDSEVFSVVVPLSLPATQALSKLIAKADVVFAFNAKLHKAALRPWLGDCPEDKSWGCIKRAWEQSWEADAGSSLDEICTRLRLTRSPEHSDVSDCQALIEVLLSHTGKTKRSRTYVGYMLSHCA